MIAFLIGLATLSAVAWVVYAISRVLIKHGVDVDDIPLYFFAGFMATGVLVLIGGFCHALGGAILRLAGAK